MANSFTVLKDTPLSTIIEQVIDNGDLGEVLDLSHARVVYVHSDQAVLFRAPGVNASGAPLDNDPDDKAIAATSSGDIVLPTTTTAGRIATNVMPAYLQIENTSGSQATVKVLIINHLYGAKVGDDIGTAGSRHNTGVGA